MRLRLCVSVTVLVVFATATVDADIEVACENNSVNITWRIGAELVPNAARFFLGSCMPSQLEIMPTGEGAVLFNYQFTECKFKRRISGKNVTYFNELTYRPYDKSKPAAFAYPIKCVYKRPEGWNFPILNPGAGVSEGRGSLIFHMALLNEHLTGASMTNVVHLGSLMPIWAAVEQKSHQPLVLLMEECVAAATSELQPDSQVYPIIGNKGCLLESLRGTAVFLPRYRSSALILYIQSSRFGLGEKVYIHCKLVAWDPEDFNESKKACHYVKESRRWDLLDDPSQSSICSCCDSTCKSHAKRAASWDSQTLMHNSVLGPLVIVDPSAFKALEPSVDPAELLSNKVPFVLT
ncbi:zona pellucida glycoprotein 3f, tandem duplicate 2 [Betta splendens]|uniref:Zona pellucida glycoprotein 3f, tandem duplicate 2 n=1 Tax=Betta splendens TaxID=158456 RepID=A0A6P7L1T7_BETSP|nr:zona pellucida glycoprotein 3f, tandem duplicate 2 [Betta splendens]